MTNKITIVTAAVVLCTCFAGVQWQASHRSGVELVTVETQDVLPKPELRSLYAAQVQQWESDSLYYEITKISRQAAMLAD